MNGRAVQLVGGRTLELDAGDPRPIAERFAIFDAFGEGFEAEGLPELDECVDEHPGVGGSGDGGDERPVDLENLHRQLGQVRKR